MLSNLACSLILHEKIKTTEAKGKEVRGFVEKLIKKSKENNLATRRQILKSLPQKEAVKKLMDNLGQRYKDFSSGFVKIYKLKRRKGDSAKEVLLQLKEVPQKETSSKEISPKTSPKASLKKNNENNSS